MGKFYFQPPCKWIYLIRKNESPSYSQDYIGTSMRHICQNRPAHAPEGWISEEERLSYPFFPVDRQYLQAPYRCPGYPKKDGQDDSVCMILTYGQPRELTTSIQVVHDILQPVWK